MKKKLALAMVGFASIMMLAACSSKQTDLVTMKGGKITVEDFFEKIKNSDEAKKALTNEIIGKVASINYGSKVSKDDVQKAFDEQKDLYKDTFDDQLKAAGYTEATFKEKLKTDLEFEAMLSDGVKVTDEQLDATWKAYHPEVEVEIAVTSDEAAAKTVAEKAASGKLEDVAKEVNTEKIPVNYKAELKFDSTNRQLPEEVKTTAFALKDGEVSKVVPVVAPNQYTGKTDTTFYVVKMVKATEKGNDMSKFKDEIQKITLQGIIYDQEFMHKRISEVLKDASIKINDNELKSVLANYIPETTEGTKDSKAEKTNKTDSSKKSESTEKTEKTDASK